MAMVMNMAVPGNFKEPVEPVQDEEKSKSGKVIVGIIYPPPEIRNIVDKTASFVARNGTSFEARIREHEANNAKFNFLNSTDPYHAYYRQKIQNLLEGKATEEPTAALKSMTLAGQLPQKVHEAMKAAEQVSAPPAPPEYEFMADPTTINAFELDLIKLTAQFVARNGRQFLTQLMTRESRNFQFDFLKPQHSNFAYFTRLVEQYSKVMTPLRNMIGEIESEIANPKKVLDNVKLRVDWERYQRRVREREEAEAERERLAFCMVDWHDFVVVQTVDFQPHETVGLPPPCTPTDVGARILAQQRYEAHKKATEAVEMEFESDEEEESPPEASKPSVAVDGGLAKDGVGSTPPVDDSTIVISAQGAKSAKATYDVTAAQPIPAPPKPESVTVRKDYNPKTRMQEKLKVDQKWVISPLTGEKVPADKLTEHLKFNTVDQQYFVQKERELMERQEEEMVFAVGSDISANIKAFAERRTDIFGVGSKGAEQTMIGKKLGEDRVRRVDPKSIWDGHAGSIELTVKAAQADVTLEEQIAQIHRSQGLLPDEDKDKIGPTILPDASSDEQVLDTAAASSRQAADTAKGGPVTAAAKPPPPPSAPAPLGSNVITSTLMYPPMMPMVPPPVGGVLYPFEVEANQAKRQKTFEDTLQPEEQWLKMHADKSPITVIVQLPNVTEKPEWKLNGGTLAVDIGLSEQVSALKAKIQQSTAMPASKQKLCYEGTFVKDALTLAYYNMLTGSVVELQVKERGGRKK